MSLKTTLGAAIAAVGITVAASNGAEAGAAAEKFECNGENRQATYAGTPESGRIVLRETGGAKKSNSAMANYQGAVNPEAAKKAADAFCKTGDIPEYSDLFPQ